MKTIYLLLLLSSVALADPISKTGELGLDPSQTNTSFHPGDEIKLVLLTKEKVGEANEQWKLDTKDTHRWVPFGDVSIDSQSIQVAESKDSFTKILLTGMLIGAGEANVQKLALINAAGNFRLEANGPVASKVGSLLSEEDKKNKAWLLDPVAIGGWNYLRIALLTAAAILLSALAAYGIYRFFRKKKKEKKKDPRDVAIEALASLENFVRGGSNRSQQEWKQFSYSLANVLRKFCEDIYHFPTHDLTDRELLESLRPHMDEKRFLESIAQILQAIDGSRYGQQGGEVAMATKLLVDAKNFIEQLDDHEKAKLAPKEEKK